MSYIWPETRADARHITFPHIDERESWPKAPSKYVCVFEAIEWAGPVACPGEWSGNELLSVEWPTSPKAQRAYERAHPPSGIAVKAVRGISGPAKPVRREAIEHVRDWHAERREKLWLENGRAQIRLDKATEWLAQLCRDGELRSYARVADGSDMLKLPSHDWNVDNPFDIFVKAGGPFRSFYELDYRQGPRKGFLFFERSELREIISRQPDAPMIVGEADLSRLSPYLRLAVHVALKRRYFEGEKIDKVLTRGAEVKAVWSEFLPDVPMTPATVSGLAKLIGFPDAEAIERGQRGGAAAKRGSTSKR
jgi:hypothetical protein